MGELLRQVQKGTLHNAELVMYLIYPNMNTVNASKVNGKFSKIYVKVKILLKIA